MTEREKLEQEAKEWVDDLPLKLRRPRDYQLFYAGFMLGQLKARKAMMHVLVGDQILNDVMP